MKCLIKATCIVVTLVLTSVIVCAKTDKYRLSYRDNPASSIVIGWNQLSGKNPKVYFGTKDYGEDWQKYENTHDVDRNTQYGFLNSNFARLSNLKPSTAYYFIIKDSDSVSKRFWFKTASDTPSEFTFVAGGDSRSNPQPRKEGNKLVAKLRPLFVLFGGDFTNQGLPEEWALWLDNWQLTISQDGRMYPILVSQGNHEYRHMTMLFELFDTPSKDMYFSIGFGGDLLRIWMLNSEIVSNNQKWNAQNSWFKSDLQKHNKAVWKVVGYHRPMHPHTSNKAEGTKKVKAWAQLMYDNGVDLVIESDAHVVKRTYPLKPSKTGYEDFEIDAKNGTVYIGEGSWGAPTRPADDNKPWTLASGSFYQFKWICINSKRLESKVVKFKNVDAVEALNEGDGYKMPKNISIWKPAQGESLILPFDEKLVPKKMINPIDICLPSGSQWKYFDKGILPDTNWASINFDDSGWLEGKAPLGYGESYLNTVISYGERKSHKYITAWFRKTFNLENLNQYKSINISLRADDGAVVYINGTEVLRKNMPNGEILDSTQTIKAIAGNNELIFIDYDIDISDFHEGKNIVAVEVHQFKGTSSDVVFDLQIKAVK